MVPNTVSHCDCCGEPIRPNAGEDCPRCGYPTNPTKEEQFLTSSLRNLNRVVAYGGAQLSVAQLIARYQQRLNYLQFLKNFSAVPQSPVVSASASSVSQTPANSSQPGIPHTPSPTVDPALTSVPPAAASSSSSQQPGTIPAAPPVLAQTVPPARQIPEHVFSLKTFFADQTINIVAALGAFLLLIGSLSFVATSSNRLFAFLVMLVVHALFGITGAFTYRFRSFRIVSVMYTAIFALQVPLVGFAGYRLVVDQYVHLSAPTLVAISAAYAALVYAVLAIYQQFHPFAYLACIALLVADLATASACNLSLWWWPTMLALLSLPLLISVSHIPLIARLFSGPKAILRQPLYFLMLFCLVLFLNGIILTFFLSLSLSGGLDLVPLHNLFEIRLSIFCALLISLCWLCLFTWQTRRTIALLSLPYLFLTCALSCCFTFDFQQIGYDLVLTAVAFLYHLCDRLLPRPAKKALDNQQGSQPQQGQPDSSASLRLQPPIHVLALHLRGLALFLVALLPCIVAPAWLTQLINLAQRLPSAPILQPLLAILVLLLGCLLTISVVDQATGLRRVPSPRQVDWCWLLLLSGFLLGWAYGIVVLSLAADPGWSFLGLTIAFMLLAVALRRFTSISWSHPLDLLSLGAVALTLLLGLQQGADRSMLLLLILAALSYAVVLYQRRPAWLFLPLMFALFALPTLLTHHRELLLLSICLPFAAAIIALFVNRQTKHPTSQKPITPVIHWEWPLLLIALFYGVAISISDLLSATSSTIQSWSGITCPVAVELAFFSLIWYAAAAVARNKSWLPIMLGFAVVALSIPSNSFWVLIYLAPVLALLSLGVSRLAGRDWAVSLYILTLYAAVIMGQDGNPQHLQAALWALLSFALLIYVIGVLERDPLLTLACIWVAPLFAAWSVFYSGLLSDYSRPPLVALTCAAVGVTIASLHLFVPALATQAGQQKLLRYRLPFYATAIIAAIFTGIYGSLFGVSHPFYGAVPDALLLYAVVAYGVLLFERKPLGLGLVAAFAIWAVMLAAQTNAYYITTIGLLTAIVGLLCTRVITLHHIHTVSTSVRYPLLKNTWGWPWYANSLAAALLIGLWPLLPLTQPPLASFLAYSLLTFAVLAYIVGVIEDMLSWSWIGVVLASWSLAEAAYQSDIIRLFVLALVCVAAAVATLVFNRFGSILTIQLRRWTRIEYALPFYAVALVAAVLTGIPLTRVWSVNTPFFAAIPAAMFLYAVLAYVLICLERRQPLLWLVAVFALWGTLLVPRVFPCPTLGTCALQSQNIVIALTVLAWISALLGLILGSSSRHVAPQPPTSTWLTRFAWNWPCYLTSCVALLLLVQSEYAALPLNRNLQLVLLCSCILLSILVLLIERAPEILLVTVALAIWTIAYTAWPLWQQMVAYTFLCILIFSSQFLWHILPPATRVLPTSSLHRVLSLVGQTLIVLIIIGNGGLFASVGILAHVGAGALAVLALLLFWQSVTQTNVVERHQGQYVAGFLISLVVSWELSALQQTHLSLLSLAPASYLIVIAPFLSRDTVLPGAQRFGHLCALAGAILLLAPTLWLSFGEDNLLPCLLLTAEALVLFLIGIGTRIKFFVLSGAALVIISAIHLLFLQSLGIPTFLALTLVGLFLLALATALILVRPRLQVLWGELE